MKDYFEVPAECPSCGHPLKIEGKFLMCHNDSCDALGVGSLNKWIYTLDVKDIGPKVIDALFEIGKLKDPADFYTLQESDISGLERMGKKSAKKILKHLNQKKELTLPEFIGGLNISNFSVRTTETLVEAGFDTIEKILNADEDDLIKIRGIEEKTASQIVNGLDEKRKLIEKLFSVGIKIKEIEKKEIKSDKLDGLSFCFTGAIQKTTDDGKRYSREMMQDLVIENGGKVGSVKKGLSYLIMADPNSNSSKAKKARDLSVNILSEEDFFKMIEE